jgi:hypothetical protein
MRKFISICIENSEDFVRHVPMRALAIDADGNVWRGTASLDPVGGTVITWTPVRCEFPASSEPAALWGSGT